MAYSARSGSWQPTKLLNSDSKKDSRANRYLRQRPVSMGILPSRADPLFSERPLGEFLAGHALLVEQRVSEFGSDEILAIPIEDLVEKIYEQFFVEPLVIHRERGFASSPVEQNFFSPEEQRFAFRGFGYEVLVPFSGAQGLFRMRPEHAVTSNPKAFVNEDGISIRIVADVGIEAVKDEVDNVLDAIEQYIQFQRPQLDQFNNQIRSNARALIQERKQRLLEARNIAASLGFPMRPREGAPITYASPVVRRKVTKELAPVKGGYTPEPTIADSDYSNILRILENMSFVIERNPKVFTRAPEETIRDHYLVQLNGQYEGQATGETFNAGGKTDILVRDGSSNLFVAECKWWAGEAKFTEAIDQLFGYLTWRDSKAAIIVFSRNKNTSGVVTAVKNALQNHTNRKHEIKQEGDTRFRTVFGRPDDPNREIIVTTLIVPILPPN